MNRLDRTRLKGALQHRAADILDFIGDREVPVSEIYQANDVSEVWVRKALKWLRDNNHAHISRYTGLPEFEMVIKAGGGIDAAPPSGAEINQKRRQRKARIPPPDPLLAHFFGLPTRSKN